MKYVIFCNAHNVFGEPEYWDAEHEIWSASKYTTYKTENEAQKAMKRWYFDEDDEVFVYGIRG